MGEHDDRRRSALTPQIVGEPGELVGAEIAHAARFEIDDIDEADEMDAGLVEGIPARALGAFAITVEIGFPLGLVDDVMFARHVVNVEPGLADDLIGVVELLGLRQMRDVAGMDHERRLGRHGDDLADRFPQRAERIGIGRLVETDMAVGNLQETEPRLGRLRRSDQRRFRHAAGERPYHAGSRPDHTFERLAAVESFILTMRHLASPRPALCRSRRRLGVRRDYSRRADLFFRAANCLSGVVSPAWDRGHPGPRPSTNISDAGAKPAEAPVLLGDQAFSRLWAADLFQAPWGRGLLQPRRLTRAPPFRGSARRLSRGRPGFRISAARPALLPARPWLLPSGRQVRLSSS